MILRVFSIKTLFWFFLPFLHPGKRENREWSHQPESGGAGRLRGAVQDQAAHAAQQADEGVLRAAGGAGETAALQSGTLKYKH